MEIEFCGRETILVSEVNGNIDRGQPSGTGADRTTENAPLRAHLFANYLFKFYFVFGQRGSADENRIKAEKGCSDIRGECQLVQRRQWGERKGFAKREEIASVGV